MASSSEACSREKFAAEGGSRVQSSVLKVQSSVLEVQSLGPEFGAADEVS